jgi:tetratricopeptide (TPR) repeat protein/O-antigen ligase
LPTKLSRYAAGVMEAAWLAAVMLVPLFFNIYSSRIFEPDKLTLLRSLALVILAAWLVKLIEEGGFHWERLTPQGGGLKAILHIPLVPIVLALVVSYLISTILSVTPFTSLWGSYQRLQGTYTTFSYLVIFFALIANLRQRVQVERLFWAVILSSLPVSLYGILQHYGADPIPWGGDVSGRIAANMGNAIFVAAYLIMVFPLTAMRALESFEALLNDRGRLWPNFARATAYVFILALQLIAIYFSGSRGPWLGLGASLVVLFLGVSLIWRKRWLTISGVVLAVIAGIFLVLLNLQNGPLEGLRTNPAFSRLSDLLNAESRTGQVRTLIWKGASELVQPHDPLEFPDGELDAFNFLRPLIGYGPESMYVAYNRFYPPELTKVEKRNASPDRSHNETWDSLVITGVLGLVIYLTLFGSLLYFGLKWLGLVQNTRQRNLYLALYLLGGLASSLIFVLWQGIPFLGVALPFGMVMGVILYMIVISVFGHVQGSNSEEEKLRSYLLLGLIGAVIAHFIEINFGIAIASTRTYFWVFGALIMLVGYILPRHNVYYLPVEGKPAQTTTTDDVPVEPARNRKATSQVSRKKSHTKHPSSTTTLAMPDWMRQALIIALVMALLLTTLGFEFVSNISRKTNALELVWASFTSPAKAGARNGVLPLLFTAWFIGALLLVSESIQSLGEPVERALGTWLKMLGISLGVSLLIGSIFWFWNATGLISLGRVAAQTVNDILSQVISSEGILTTFYIHVFLIVFGMAAVLPQNWPSRATRGGPLSFTVAAVVLISSFLLVAITNLRVIQADIAFKTGDLFARPNSWPAAIAIYNHANDLAPNEDYYYLFLGRAYLEYAKTLQDTPERERLITQAGIDLVKAQQINPLNTDHTANLARLYSLWATFTQDQTVIQQRANVSNDYFTQALMLSPNNARLWDEWAVLDLNVLNQPDQAKEHLDRALAIDPYYDWTYALMGDYYNRNVSSELKDQPDKQKEAQIQAGEYYSQALKLGEGVETPQLMYNYAIALGGIQAQLDKLDQAILSYEKAIQISPDAPERWRVEAALAQLYARMGNLPKALEYAHSAQSLAPDDQKQVLASLIQQLGGQP